MTTGGEQVFDEAYRVLKTRISDPSSESAQASAIHTLGAVTFFGGADITEVDGSHVIMISQPQAVVDVIESAIAKVG